LNKETNKAHQGVRACRCLKIISRDWFRAHTLRHFWTYW